LRAKAALASDPDVLEKSGGVFTTPVIAREYGVTDADGKQQSAFWDSTWPAPGAFRSYTLGAAPDRVTVRLA
jgi:hypothetical protein